MMNNNIHKHIHKHTQHLIMEILQEFTKPTKPLIIKQYIDSPIKLIGENEYHKIALNIIPQLLDYIFIDESIDNTMEYLSRINECEEQMRILCIPKNIVKIFRKKVVEIFVHNNTMHNDPNRIMDVFNGELFDVNKLFYYFPKYLIFGVI